MLEAEARGEKHAGFTYAEFGNKTYTITHEIIEAAYKEFYAEGKISSPDIWHIITLL